MDTADHPAKKKHMRKGMMGGKRYGRHLHIFILGVVDEKPRVYRQKNRQPAKKQEYKSTDIRHFIRHINSVRYFICDLPYDSRSPIMHHVHKPPQKQHNPREHNGKRCKMKPQCPILYIHILHTV